MTAPPAALLVLWFVPGQLLLALSWRELVADVPVDAMSPAARGAFVVFLMVTVGLVGPVVVAVAIYQWLVLHVRYACATVACWYWSWRVDGCFPWQAPPPVLERLRRHAEFEPPDEPKDRSR